MLVRADRAEIFMLSALPRLLVRTGRSPVLFFPRRSMLLGFVGAYPLLCCVAGSGAPCFAEKAEVLYGGARSI